MNPIRKTLIILNAAGILVFAALWFHASWLAPIETVGRVTDLDRQGIIDIPKLTTFNAALASNVRYNLARWIAERDQQASTFNAIAGLLICIANLLVLVGGGRSNTVAVRTIS